MGCSFLKSPGEHGLIVELDFFSRAENSEPTLLGTRSVEIGDFDPAALHGQDRLANVVLLFEFLLQRHRFDGDFELARNLWLKREIDGADVVVRTSA